MYPTISDLLKDLFGVDIPLPIQSFGFFVAMAFVTAAWLLMLELKRKEKLQIISAQMKKIWVGKPASASELAVYALVSFVLGYKLVSAFTNYSEFVDNPQSFVFSLQGSFIGGLISAVIITFLRYREKNKQKLDKPKLEEVLVRPYELSGNMLLIAAVFGILGAKIFHNLENIDEFMADPIGSLFSFSGLTFYGGLICATVAVVWYAKKNKIPALVICDAAAPGIMLAYAIGRIGCQVSGDGDWGIVNDMIKPEWLGFLPDWIWSYHYPHNVLSEGVPIPGCDGKYCFMLDPPVFPTPFYETLICSFCFIILWIIRKRIHTAGVIFAIFLILNGVERFFIEKIRVNTTYHIFGNEITQAEIISTLLVITGVLMLFKLTKKKNNLSSI